MNSVPACYEDLSRLKLRLIAKTVVSRTFALGLFFPMASGRPCKPCHIVSSAETRAGPDRDPVVGVPGLQELVRAGVDADAAQDALLLVEDGDAVLQGRAEPRDA